MTRHLAPVSVSDQLSSSRKPLASRDRDQLGPFAARPVLETEGEVGSVSGPLRREPSNLSQEPGHSSCGRSLPERRPKSRDALRPLSSPQTILRHRVDPDRASDLLPCRYASRNTAAGFNTCRPYEQRVPEVIDRSAFYRSRLWPSLIDSRRKRKLG